VMHQSLRPACGHASLRTLVRKPVEPPITAACASAFFQTAIASLPTAMWSGIGTSAEGGAHATASCRRPQAPSKACSLSLDAWSLCRPCSPLCGQ
jgi:hypothetical protein